MDKVIYSYKKSGVDYDLLDPVKLAAQKAGFQTRNNLFKVKISEISQSRGESSFVLDTGKEYLAFVQEGLGTKNLVADSFRKISGRTYYETIAQDTVATVINDLITVGAKPLTMFSYWAVGDSNWFTDRKRNTDLVNGWKKACDLSGCIWGGGETPTLKNIIYPTAIDLAGSACGLIFPKKNLIMGDKVRPGDEIIFIESSGIHANGLTLARKLAGKLPQGYSSRLANGQLYGEALLVPTFIYAKLTSELLEKGIDIHYMINITGHGWRKLMRLKKTFTYRIDKIPPVPEIFSFMQKKAKLKDREMYATFNMGAGFALIINPKDAKKALTISAKHQLKAWQGGKVLSGTKQIIINPLGISYQEKELNIRK